MTPDNTEWQYDFIREDVWKNGTCPLLEKIADNVLAKLKTVDKATLEEICAMLGFEGLNFNKTHMFWIWEVLANRVPCGKRLVVRPIFDPKTPTELVLKEVEFSLADEGSYLSSGGEVKRS